MARYPKKVGRKAVSPRGVTQQDWKEKLNASLARHGERPVGMRHEIHVEFERSKHFQKKQAAAGGGDFQP